MPKKDALSQTDIDIIRSLAKNGLNRSSASRELHYANQTVAYHVDRIKEVTGMDPRDFYDMIKLLKMVGEGELDD